MAKHHALWKHAHPEFAVGGPNEVTSLRWGCSVGRTAFPRVTGYQRRSAVCGTRQGNSPESQGHVPQGAGIGMDDSMMNKQRGLSGSTMNHFRTTARCCP